ncbi:MAG: glucohydrolase, partial [Clostridia bacterium]|nr:glucohydrolase [Clostridia bacterium]
LVYYKKLINFRENSKILVEGSFDIIEIQRDVFIYSRESKGERIVVAINLSKKFHTVQLDGQVLISNYSLTEFGGTLRPFEAVILDVPGR